MQLDLGLDLTEKEKKEAISLGRKVLKRFRQLSRVSRVSNFLATYSPSNMNDMPKTEPNPRGTENNIVRELTRMQKIENECLEVVAALDKLTQESRSIIIMAFKEDKSISDMAFDLGYSDVHVKRKKKLAVLEFCEVYKDGEIMNAVQGKFGK